MEGIINEGLNEIMGIGEEGLKEKIKKILSKILQQKFGTSKQKQNIKESKEYLTCACPICGDSYENEWKKRGVIYLDSYQYHCYNCGSHMGILKFIKRYEKYENEYVQMLSIQDRTEIYQKEKNEQNKNEKEITGMFWDVGEVIKYCIEWDEFKNEKEYEEPRGEVKTWLEKRYQRSDRFLYSRWCNGIIIPHYIEYENKRYVINYQIRYLASKIKYKTFTYDVTLSQYFKNEYKQSEYYNLLQTSGTNWGIFNLNFDKPVTIFEGPFDSYLYPEGNSGCMLTVANKWDFELFDIRYFLDYDKSGNKKSVELLKKGYSVFLWNKFLDEHNINGSRYDKIDMTDLYHIIGEKKIKEINNWNEYFSQNALDIIYL